MKYLCSWSLYSFEHAYWICYSLKKITLRFFNFLVNQIVNYLTTQTAEVEVSGWQTTTTNITNIGHAMRECSIWSWIQEDNLSFIYLVCLYIKNIYMPSDIIYPHSVAQRWSPYLKTFNSICKLEQRFLYYLCIIHSNLTISAEHLITCMVWWFLCSSKQ